MTNQSRDRSYDFHESNQSEQVGMLVNSLDCTQREFRYVVHVLRGSIKGWFRFLFTSVQEFWFKILGLVYVFRPKYEAVQTEQTKISYTVHPLLNWDSVSTNPVFVGQVKLCRLIEIPLPNLNQSITLGHIPAEKEEQKL